MSVANSPNEVVALVVSSVKVPVVAAGGVAAAERVAEVMKAGADGVRMGTRFVTSPESGADPDYVARLLAAGDDSTILTEWFGEGWEHAPHRVLKSALTAAQESGWRAAIPPYRNVGRDVSDMAMYAGTGVAHVTATVDPGWWTDMEWGPEREPGREQVTATLRDLSAFAD